MMLGAALVLALVGCRQGGDGGEAPDAGGHEEADAGDTGYPPPRDDLVAPVGTAGSLDIATWNIENFPAGKLGDKTLTLRGVRGRFRSSVKAAIKIMESGRYPLEELCTHHYSVEEMETGLRQVARELDKEVLHVAMMPH